MCGICGCSEEMHDSAHHVHDKQAVLAHPHDEGLIHIEQDILAKNNQFAQHNKKYFAEKNILAMNIMSSPGSGKTTLLTKTISDLKSKIQSAVIVGDQQTDYDATMIKSSGVPAVQVNTGKVCHLDAHMIGHAIEKLPIKERMILFIENVGNLVCPALFNLGENYKIVVLSVTEGDNKPLKYPDMFHSADLMILTKIDLLPYVEFDVDKCIDYARRIKPNLEVLTLSATQGQGLTQWYNWLMQKQK
jgi:hydrogenase nickel incorporation protein HypB